MTEKFQCHTEIFQSEKMVKNGKTEIFQCGTEIFQSEKFASGKRVKLSQPKSKNLSESDFVAQF